METGARNRDAESGASYVLCINKYICVCEASERVLGHPRVNAVVPLCALAGRSKGRKIHLKHEKHKKHKKDRTKKVKK